MTPPERKGFAAWLRGLARPDGYTIAGCIVFLVIVVCQWTSYVASHETLYLLGSRRVADPRFLAVDFTWSRLPPTTFLYDHLLAPLWSFFGVFGIANIGRLASWLLFTWSIVVLTRTLRFPPWCVALGFTVWILWDETLAPCGAPLEGLQVKSFAYPLMFFSLAFAMRGQMVAAGLASGLATAFHIVVGGWGCLAIFLSLLAHRKEFAWRQVGIFLLSTAPFIVPLLVAVALFHEGGVPAAQRASMDELYVMFWASDCCDMDYFMTNDRWVRAALIFSISTILAWIWSPEREGRMLRSFVPALILFFFLGEAAQRLKMYGLLKLFPGQLAVSLPALFLFILIPSFFAARRPVQLFGWIGSSLMLVATTWLVLDRHVPAEIVEAPGEFVSQLRMPVWGAPRDGAFLYEWVRTNTPQDSIFITPYLRDFWTYGERAQVASLRQPPLDHRMFEWKERLEALNKFRPLTTAKVDFDEELDVAEGALSIDELIRIRKMYGATHYVTNEKRPDLAGHLLYETTLHAVYDITALTAAVAEAAPVGKDEGQAK